MKFKISKSTLGVDIALLPNIYKYSIRTSSNGEYSFVVNSKSPYTSRHLLWMVGNSYVGHYNRTCITRDEILLTKSVLRYFRDGEFSYV